MTQKSNAMIPLVGVTYSVDMLPPYMHTLGPDIWKTVVDFQWDPFNRPDRLGQGKSIIVHVDKWHVSEKVQSDMMNRFTANRLWHDGGLSENLNEDQEVRDFNTRLAIVSHFGLGIDYNQQYVDWFAGHVSDLVMYAYRYDEKSLKSDRLFNGRIIPAKEWFDMMLEFSERHNF